MGVQIDDDFGHPSPFVDDDPPESTFDRKVARVVDELRVRAEARARLDAEQTVTPDLPPVHRLDDFLAVPDEPIAYRIDGLWPRRGRVVLAAPHKAGKSTFVGNALRSLADGAPFLDQFDVRPADRIILVDDELDENMLRRWLRAQGITYDTRIELITLRGRLSTFNVLDPATRTQWAAHLQPADVLILDCLRPVLDALGLDENHDAGRFLEALDELLTEAGIPEALVVHHTGHAGDRSRGDSRILDWPDALWQITRDKTDDDESTAQADRYFSAYGRDVDQAQVLLGYDPDTRRLNVAGGSRNDVHTDAALDTVASLLADSTEPLSVRRILEALAESEHPQRTIRTAIKKVNRPGMSGDSLV